MMSYLAERVATTLKYPGVSLWFPELTKELVEAGWQDLYLNTGLSPDTYGTARAMAQNASAPLYISANLPMFSSSKSFDGMLRLEILNAEFISYYEEAGIRFYTAQEIATENLLIQFQEALNLLKTTPTLFRTIATLVSSIHLLDPGNDDYDVSFSEPHIPFSIFVSVPRVCSVINTLRLSEAIVHEAMHLQLTLIEKITPLIIPTSNKYFSPWREEYRSPQGVLHALYVFRVIEEFLSNVSLDFCSVKEEEYILERRTEINTQVEKIKTFQDCSDLTVEGSYFVRRLITI